jgi:hypothetical protein
MNTEKKKRDTYYDDCDYDITDIDDADLVQDSLNDGYSYYNDDCPKPRRQCRQGRLLP